MFELNKFKQYRIKQLVGSYYKFLSGDAESNGWVKSGALAAKNKYNEIDIRVKLPQVDIYVNGKFLQSFDVLEYKPGGMGSYGIRHKSEIRLLLCIHNRSWKEAEAEVKKRK